MKKRLSKTLWYGTDVDSEGKPIVPNPATSSDDLGGLHKGELFLHLKDGSATLWSLSSNNTVVQISGGGSFDLSQYLLKSVWDKAWEFRTDSNGVEYIFGKLPLVINGGITMYGLGDSVDVPSGGGSGGGGVSNFWDLNGIPSWITETKPVYSYNELQGKPDLANYVSINGDEIVNGYKNFKKGIGINGLGITNTQDDVIYIDANLVVRGGITMYATDTVDIPSILDSIPVASNTAKGLASFDATYFSIDNGRVTLLPDNVGLNESELAAYLSDKGYATQLWVTNKGYATLTALEALEERVDESLLLYVPIAGYTEITGEKDFVGGLKVNGKQIQYIPIDGDSGYWKLEGDLLVTGGITMFANEGTYTPSTIMDGLILDSATLGINDEGQLYVKGGTGGGVADSVAWENVTGKPSFATVATSGKYSDLIGRPTLLSSFTNDVGYLNSHQTIYNLTLQAGSFSAKTFDPNGAAMTVNIPTTTSHISEGSNLYFTNARAVSALASTLSGYLPLSGGTLTQGSQSTTLEVHSTVASSSWITPLLTRTPNMQNGGHCNIEVGKSSSARNLAWFGFKYDSDGSYNNLLTIGMHSVDDALVINGYGYVGVGTLSPTTALDIYDGDVTANAYRVGRWNNSKEDNMTNQLDYTISYLRTTNQVCGGNTLQHIIGWANTLNGTSETRYTIGSWRGADGYGKMIFNVLSPNNRLLELGLNGKTGYLQLTGSSEFGQYNQKMHHLFYGIGTGDGYYSVVELVSPNEVSISYGDNQRYSDPYRWSVGRAGVGSSARFQFWNAVSNTAVVQIFTSGDFLTTGGITMYSDIRKKTKLQDVELSLSQIANAPLIEHYYNSDDKRTTHVGSIAQYWAGMNDWFCKKDQDGFYTMEIQNAALASAISVARHLQKYETKTDRTIRKLKKRISELEDEVEKLKSA